MKKRLYILTPLFAWILIGLLLASPVLGHGGKQHSDNDFTKLRALQQATKLYNKLITDGKLGEGWEVDLRQVEITERKTGDKQETVVKFLRSVGSPEAVYFFFTPDGKYAGSNTTGK